MFMLHTIKTVVQIEWHLPTLSYAIMLREIAKKTTPNLWDMSTCVRVGSTIKWMEHSFFCTHFTLTNCEKGKQITKVPKLVYPNVSGMEIDCVIFMVFLCKLATHIHKI